VNELRGIPVTKEDEEISIDVNVSAYIDNDYIGDENQKIDMYKKIASINDEQDVIDAEDELMDRYGEIPQPVKNLLQIAYIKSLAKACGFSSVQEKNDTVIFQYSESKNINFEVLGKLMDKYRRKLLFTASNRPYITFKTTGVKGRNFSKLLRFCYKTLRNCRRVIIYYNKGSWYYCVDIKPQR